MKQFLKDRSNIAFLIAIALFVIWAILEIIGDGKSTWALVLAIAVLIFALTALFIPKKNVPVSTWNKFINSSFPLLLALVLLPYFLERALNITWFPEAVVAYGTLLLAVATYQLGQTTISENKKLHDDTERVRKEEQRTDAILRLRQWAERSIISFNTTYPIMQSLQNIAMQNVATREDVANMRILNPSALWQFGNMFRQLKAESFGVKADSKKIGGKVLELCGELSEKIISLSDGYLKPGTPPPDFVAIDKQQEEIIKKLHEILKTIAEE
jgi:uncharacterized membrane protein YhaH (DUF805 family)